MCYLRTKKNMYRGIIVQNQKKQEPDVGIARYYLLLTALARRYLRENKEKTNAEKIGYAFYLREKHPKKVYMLLCALSITTRAIRL